MRADENRERMYRFLAEIERQVQRIPEFEERNRTLYENPDEVERWFKEAGWDVYRHQGEWDSWFQLRRDNRTLRLVYRGRYSTPI